MGGEWTMIFEAEMNKKCKVVKIDWNMNARSFVSVDAAKNVWLWKRDGINAKIHFVATCLSGKLDVAMERKPKIEMEVEEDNADMNDMKRDMEEPIVENETAGSGFAFDGGFGGGFASGFGGQESNEKNESLAFGSNVSAAPVTEFNFGSMSGDKNENQASTNGNGFGSFGSTNTFAFGSFGNDKKESNSN